MKKIKWIMMVSFVIGIFFSHTDAKAGSVWLVMGKHKQHLKKGDVFKTKFKFTTWEAAMGAHAITVHYDPEMLQILKVSTSKKSLFYGNLFADEASFSTGKTVITAFQVEEATKKKNPETFVKIKWKALKNVDEPLPISIEAKTLVDFLWRQVDVLTYGEYKYATLTKEDLLAYWTFDDCTVTDESDNGYDGTLYNNPKCVDGIRNSAIDIDDDNDYIELKKTLDPNEMKAVSFWINSRGANKTNDYGTIIAKYNWNNRRSFILWSYDGNMNKIGVKYYVNGSSHDGDSLESYYEEPDSLDPDKYTVINNAELELNTWKHVVVNTTETEIEIWIDGKITNKVKRDYTEYYNSSEPTYIGNTFQIGDDFDYNNQLNGILDDFRIYKRPLTESEIQGLYTEDKASKKVSAVEGNIQ